MESIDSIWLALGSAFWLGILTAISPCPMATNIAAVSYVGGRIENQRRVLLSGLLYTLGRCLAYLVLGSLAVWSLISVFSVSVFLQNVIHRGLGPFLIVAGLLLLGLVTVNVPGFGFGGELRQRIDKAGIWGALLLGVLFAISFCPVSAGLFFGCLIPLAVEQQSPLLLPAAYGLATALPVMVFAALLAAGANRLATALEKLRSFEIWARRVTAAVFIAVGIYETLRSTLHLL